jgi:hypothetical protein
VQSNRAAFARDRPLVIIDAVTEDQAHNSLCPVTAVGEHLFHATENSKSN